MTPEAGWTGPRKQRLQRSPEVGSMRLKMLVVESTTGRMMHPQRSQEAGSTRQKTLVAESTGQMMWRQ
jgi:hypothetical protein